MVFQGCSKPCGNGGVWQGVGPVSLYSASYHTDYRRSDAVKNTYIILFIDLELDFDF